MKKIALVALAGVLLYSCNSNNVEEVDRSLVTTDSAQATIPAAAGASDTSTLTATEAETEVTISNPTINPAGNPPVQLTPPVIAKPAAPATAKLNPAHGQPGHRCDIAVGAPLNSAPQAPANITPAPAPSTNITTAPVAVPAAAKPALPAAPGVKINPPHGEPGHDCSVQVGAPLKG